MTKYFKHGDVLYAKNKNRWFIYDKFDLDWKRCYSYDIALEPFCKQIPRNQLSYEKAKCRLTWAMEKHLKK